MCTIEKGFLGFPAPLLGENSLKLNALAYPGKWVAVEKPSRIPIKPDSGSTAHSENNLETALQAKASDPLPSWKKWGLGPDFRPKSIFAIDTALHGFGLWALNDSTLKELRNHYGSSHFTFTYEFLARDHADSGSEYSVNLPVAQHLQDPSRYVISTTTGKKAETDFSKIQSWPRAGIALWSAQTTRTRGHQIRLHAIECGLTILGEDLYANDPGVSLLDLKKKRISKRREAAIPFWPGLNIHLNKLQSPKADLDIGFARPALMQTLIRKLDQFSL
ncbi:MAG: hypothetical protein ACPGN3_06170 [Opitutales bacterium]